MDNGQIPFEEMYVLKNNKKLRLGYTTGSCAAAAAKAAAMGLLLGDTPSLVPLMTPKGILLQLETEDIQRTDEYVSCAVRKYSGDDPDVTNGALVYAKVRRAESSGITVDGGVGVGRVTRKGLDQPVGAAAINRVPRQMIREAVEDVCERADYHGGIFVEISIPAGVELAAKTFNPRLGIEGGISVLGTSGIVMPMSEEALIKSIEVEMRMRLADGEEYLLITPGNYGKDFLRDWGRADVTKSIQCSNYVGATIDMALEMGVKGILFVSHIGKFVKVAAGIMNTHSREADSRAEILAAHAVLAGADTERAKRVLQTATTDEALEILNEAGLVEPMMKSIMEKIRFYLDKRAYGKMKMGAILFSNQLGFLGETETADELLELMRQGRRGGAITKRSMIERQEVQHE